MSAIGINVFKKYFTEEEWVKMYDMDVDDIAAAARFKVVFDSIRVV